jgi:THO complex subunit 2
VKGKKRISAEKKHYFSSVDGKDNIDDMHLHLLEQCFLPRALLSSLDALYSFTMLKLLHDFGTPGFSTVNLLGRLMNKQKLAAVMFQCTAMEAQHFGRFLCELLKLLQGWHSSQATYEKEAHGASKQLPGFQKSKSKEFIDFEDFRRLFYNWHSYLNGALQMCFESGEYMHIRNGIIVLRAIVPVFPIVNFMGHNMVKHVTALSNEESRQDLKLAAMSLLGPLKNREKQWILPQAFRINDASKQSAKAGSRAPSVNPETPQGGADTPKLSATAPEFKPGQAALPNGTRKESIAGVEDGEIEDEKQLTSKGGDEVTNDAPVVKADIEASQATAVSQEAKTKTQESDKTASTSTKEAEKAASRPSTPAAVPSKPPLADSSRASSTQQAASSRPGHTLPSRPDSRPSNRPLPTPPTDRQSGRYASRADDKYGRLDRPNDLRPASRDHSPGGRGRPRTPERDPRDPYYSSFAAARGGPPRDDRGPIRPAGPPDSRYSRDDPYMSTRRDHPPQQAPHPRPPYESRERTNGPMGPPPAQAAHSDRPAYPGAVSQQSSRATSSTAQASPSQDQPHVNPARLALINEDTVPGRGRGRDLIGPPKDTRRDRDTREDRGPPESRTNATRDAAVEPPRDTQSRNPPPADVAPTGPRRGRQNRDLSVQGPTESSFGRLNGPPQDVPSGPRPPNGPGGRNTRGFAPQPAPPATSRSNESPVPSPSTARPPESPAAFRGPNLRATNDRRGSGQQFERQPSANSVPTTPATENGPSVHPSRMGQVGVQPAPIQTNVAANAPGSATSPTSAPPSGPRGPGRAPSGPATGPSSAAPPSGPASAVERQRRSDRQRADINATLQGASVPAPNGQGVSFRGAAQNRQPNAPVSSAANAPPVQALASPMEPPVRRNEPPAGRQEPPANAAASRGDLFQGKPERNDEGARLREDGRPDRARGSRNASRERRPDDEPPQRPQPPPMEDRRDRRSGPRDDRRERDGYEAPPGREMRPGERPFRNDDAPPRRPPAQEAAASYPGPPPDWDRANDRRGPRRDAPDDSRRGGRGGGRAEEFRGPRREEERRDVGRMPPSDGLSQIAGRKRRHDDGGPPAFDESKRRRSGR